MRALYALPDPEASIADFASRRAALTREELVAVFGVSRLRSALKAGTLTRVLPGVYAAATHASAFHVRAHAASLWADAPISGAAALYLWELIDEPPRIEVAIPHDRSVRAPDWIGVRRLSVEPPTSTRGGIQVLAPAWAIVTGYGAVAEQQRAEVVFGAIRRRLVGPRQLENALAAAPRVKARRSLARRIDSASRGAQSHLEEVGLREVFNTSEFARLVRQHEVVVEGVAAYLDLYDRSTRTAIELDGGAFHTGEQRRRDIRRDARLATVGIQTVRLDYRDVTGDPEECRRIVRAVLCARRSR